MADTQRVIAEGNDVVASSVEGNDHVATGGERAALEAMGEAKAVAQLRMPRSTLARISGGFRVRTGTLALFRQRLAQVQAHSVEARIG